jgi:hypothetical protein
VDVVDVVDVRACRPVYLLPCTSKPCVISFFRVQSI